MGTERVPFPVSSHGTGESALQRVLVKSLLSSDDAQDTQNKLLKNFRPANDSPNTTYPGKRAELLWKHVENIIESARHRVPRCDVLGLLLDDLSKPEGPPQVVPKRQLEMPKAARVPLYRQVPTTPERNILSNFELSKVNGVLCYPMTESQFHNFNSMPSPTTQLPVLTQTLSTSPIRFPEEARTSSLETLCGTPTSHRSSSRAPSVSSVSSHGNVNDIPMNDSFSDTAAFSPPKSTKRRKTGVLDGGPQNRVSDFEEPRMSSWSRGHHKDVKRRSRIPIRKANPPNRKETYSKRFEDKGSQTSPACGRDSEEIETVDSCGSTTSESLDLDAKVAEVLARPTPPGLVRGESWDSTDEFLAKLSPLSIPSILDDVSTDFSDDSELSPHSEWSIGSGSEPTSQLGTLEERSPEPFTICSPESYETPSPEAFESRSPERFQSQSPEESGSISPGVFVSGSTETFGSESSETFEPDSPEDLDRGSPDAFEADPALCRTAWSPQANETQSPQEVGEYSPEGYTARSPVDFERRQPIARARNAPATCSERPQRTSSKRKRAAYSERTSVAYSKRSSASRWERPPVVYPERPSAVHSERPPVGSAGQFSSDHARRASSDYRARSPDRKVRHTSETHTGRSYGASKPRSTARPTVSQREEFRRPSFPASRRKLKPPPPMSAGLRHEYRSGREKPPDRRAKSVSTKRASELNYSPYF